MTDENLLSKRDREVIAAAYEVDAAYCRSYPTRNPFVWFTFRLIASFLDERAKSIRRDRRMADSKKEMPRG